MARFAPFVLTASLLLPPLSARAQWALNGNPISTVANNETFATVIADGSGGAFVLWEDYRTGSFADVYLQRVNVSGAPQWAVNGVPVCTAVFNQKYPVMIADGAGGVIVAWDDDRLSAANKDIYAQRVNGSGVVQWTANGVALCTATNHQQYPHIASDGTGGAIVSWNDDRSGANSNHTYAQRVNSAGAPQWTANGVAVQTATNGGEQTIISDGVGGALVAFLGGTGGLSVQRLNAPGVPQWTANGVALAVTPFAQTLVQMVSDGASGAIVGWSDNRSGNLDIYARRVTAAGAPQWTANGVALCTAADGQYVTTMTSNGAGGAILAWEDRRNGTTATYYDIYAQQVTSSGTVSWSPHGVAVCTAAGHQIFAQMVSDGAGGAIIAWADFRTSPPVSPFTSVDVYAQRVSNTGAALWTANGVPICITAEPGLQSIAPNGVGGAIAVWRDSRNIFFDIYAQRIEGRHGNWGRPDGWLTSVADVPGDQGGHVMARWDASDRDVFPTQEVSHYTLWRELSPSAVTSLAAASTDDARFVDPSTIGPDFTGKAYRQSITAAGSASWEFIATIPTRYATGYGFNTPTLSDSVASNSADGTYQVLSHTTNAFVYYEGNRFTGHSVDNLSPPAPLSLTAQRAGANVNLKWNRVHVTDLRDYSVYRATSTGVTPLPPNFLADSEDTILVDAGAPASALYYIVTASDVHDNQGPKSNEAAVSALTGAGHLPPITALTVLPNHPNPFTGVTHFDVGLPGASDISLEVYDVAGRRVHAKSLPKQAAGWRTVKFDGRDHAGRVLASGVYFCRVTANGTTVTRKMVIAR